MAENALATAGGLPAQLAERPQDVIARIRESRDLVVTIQRELMKAGVHFGVLPGTDKPMLLKDGADLLNQAFHLEAREEGVLDLGSPDERKFQVSVAIYNAAGRRLGFGVGVCSTSEDKYKWRKAYKNEYDAAPVDRRRTKEYRNPEGTNTVYQVRTEPADLENTVLQMATKRAYVQATRQVHAVSDVFADIGLEDLPEEQRDQLLLGGRRVRRPERKQQQGGSSAGAAASGAKAPPPAARQPGGDDEGSAVCMVPASSWAAVTEAWHNRNTISLAQSKRLFAIASGAGWQGSDLDREIEAGLHIRQDAEGKYPIPAGRPYELVVEIFSHAP